MITKLIPRRISVKFVVALAISLSMLLLSAILIYQAFSGMKSNLVASTQDKARGVSDSVKLSMKATLLPSHVTLRLLSHDAITEADSIEKRLRSLPVFAETLLTTPISSAVFIAYDNGELFLLRMAQQEDFDRPDPPLPGTRFVLQTRTRSPHGGYDTQAAYYDSSLGLLEQHASQSYAIDPRARFWFAGAIDSGSIHTTPPYMFYSTGEVGVTMTLRSERGKAVIGLDITVSEMTDRLNSLRITPHTEMAIIDSARNVLAYPGAHKLTLKNSSQPQLLTLALLQSPVLTTLAAQETQPDTLVHLNDGQTDWYGFTFSVAGLSDDEMYVLIAIPAHELFEDARNTIMRQGLLAGGIVLVMLMAGWKLGKRIVTPLHLLTEQVSELGEFNFTQPIGVDTCLKEVQDLGAVLQSMAGTISSFLNISLTLSKESDLEQMLSSVLRQLLAMVRLNRGCIYLYDDLAQHLTLTTAEGDGFAPVIPLPAEQLSDALIVLKLQVHAHDGDSTIVLRNREGELVGVLTISCATDTNECVLHDSLLQFIHKLASSAAVAIETRQLILTQRALLKGVITLIADAVDTKSQYTGGHCRRVPELARIIMEHIKTSDDPYFAGFSMTPAQEEEFRIAAWLHDCGKITTPEYVVDKATKLETIYNRIHEIRTRFELLHRDAAIRCLTQLADGADETLTRQRCMEEQGRLQDDFAFVARCNIGSESIQPDDLARLRQIGQKTWLRHFDCSLGLSHDEQKRMGNPPAPPAEERLLADARWHIIPWQGAVPPVRPGDPRNIWGFDMSLPDCMYNYGELYNLGIARGTLTAEERFTINAHSVQTICMLSKLPLPAALRQVPAIAGNHHETMAGTGYPRKLHGSRMSLAERVMAVADVFEALTAADRPYKDGKTLTEALGIMASMCRDRHLDVHVFTLFLRSGAFMEYARAFVLPEQCDTVNIDDFIIRPAAGAPC